MNGLIKKFRIKSFKESRPIVELQNLSITYGNRQIVEKLNLSIQKNEVSGLLGPNGAGKSSIYHSIIGLVKPSFGKIIIIAEIHIKNKEERLLKINNLIRKFELQNVIKLKSKFLSGGQVRKLTLAMAMVKDTRILILDEPFAALDPQSVRMIQQIIVSLQMFEKISVSISDHSSRDLLNTVDSAMVLTDGRIVAKGTPQELVRNTKAIEAYFGEGFKI